MTIYPNRFIKRAVTKAKHRLQRTWTSFAVKDGTIYRIDNKMYQVFNGRYIRLGDICTMCDDLDNIKQSEIINN